MYGGVGQQFLNEESNQPKSPYAAAKLFSYEMTKIYRDSYGIFVSNGIYLIMNLHTENLLQEK